MNPYEAWYEIDKAQNSVDIRMYEKLYHDKNVRSDAGLLAKVKEGLEMLYDERRQLKAREVYKVCETGKALFGWS